MRILLILFINSCALLSYAQESSPITNKLLEIYTQQDLERLESNHPTLLLRLKYYMTDAFQIIDRKDLKSNLKWEGEIDMNPDDFNILKLEREKGISPDSKKRKIYKIKNTEQALIYFSTSEFNDAFNAYRQNIKS